MRTNNFTIFFGIFLISMLFVPPSISTVQAQDSGIPAWIKNNAGWWATDQIDDLSFLQGIQFLIKEGIMVIPPTETSESSGSEGIPTWIKNNAGWWADGQIDDGSFVSGIQWLVSNGIIAVEQQESTTTKPLDSKTISNNPLYKTYTNELKIQKLKYDITLQYPADWFLEEINKISAWTSTTELLFIVNPTETVFIWIGLVPWLSETEAETYYGTPGAVKIGLKNWCSSKTFQSDGFVCRDLNQDVKTITKYGKKQYHVFASYTLDDVDGDIDEKKNLTAVITNINSSWKVSVLTSSNHWDRYKHDIYSIIDSIQTVSNNVKSNESGLLRLTSNVYELPMSGAKSTYQNIANIDVFGEFSEGKVGSITMKVIKPDGKIDQENVRTCQTCAMSRDGTSFNHQYKIKSDFPIGKYQITVSTNINDIQLGPISFTVIAADPENQICGGTGYGSGYGYYSERLGTPPPGVCIMINNPVLEK